MSAARAAPGHATRPASLAAIDLGASSGRVMLARVAGDQLSLEEVHRFPTEPVLLPDGLHTSAVHLFREMLEGLRRLAHHEPEFASIGIDTWGVDFGLLDEDGALLGEPSHYRDARHAGGIERVDAVLSRAEHYAITGTQHLPFNTINQLAAIRDRAMFAAAQRLLLLPDLFGYWLTGALAAERTHASTTALLDATAGEWAWRLMDLAGIPRSLFATLRDPGDRLGAVREELRHEAALPPDVVVTVVGSHDTASAVAAVPASTDRHAFLASGTWSLFGVALNEPILSEQSRAANFTNERGVDGTVLYLRNVMGLWLLQECMREWATEGTPEQLDQLLAAASRLPAGGPMIDPDDTIFLPPGDMPRRIVDACLASGSRPETRPAIVRVILDSLARAHARALADATRLSGASVEVVHVVGGGSQNALLCQLTADACRLPVIAGPVEAAALGNALVQARSLGAIANEPGVLRDVSRASASLKRYEPRPTPAERSSGFG